MATRKSPTKPKAKVPQPVAVEPGSRILASPASYKKPMLIGYQVEKVVKQTSKTITFIGHRLARGGKGKRDEYTKPREHIVAKGSVQAFPQTKGKKS